MADKDWIQTFSGRKFYPLNPSPGDVRIDDIARALSMMCRYNGHVARFYSVAEHSVRVSRIVYERTGDTQLALWGLLHDASEAYLNDITRPVKHQPALAEYRRIEKLLQATICKMFGLPEQEPIAVTEVDYEILGTEAYQLKQPIHPDWAKASPTGTLPAPLPIGPLGWSPALAEGAFLHQFRKLTELDGVEDRARALEAVLP